MISKDKVLKIRENADKLLKKMEMDEKDKYKKIVLEFQNSQNSIDKILEKLNNDKTFDQLKLILTQLKDDFEYLIIASKPDFSPLVKSIQDLTYYTRQKKDYSDTGIINAIDSLNRNLAKLETKQGKDRTDEVIKAIKEIKLEAGEAIEFPESISINNFPPQKIPQPVTHISINSLKGLVHTTSTTVSTTLTAIPGYGVLENRRSLIFQNLSSTIDVYIGGSDVTSDNGYKLEAGSVSPGFDSGPSQIWYGVTASGTADIRCVELPDESSGR